MNKILLALSLLLCTAALADTPAGAGPAAADCEAKAIDKNGKPLAGAAKASFVKKCEKDAAPKPAATDKPAAK